MPRTAIDRAFKGVGQLATEYGPTRIGLDVNIVIGGPGTTRETAVDDAVLTAHFALTAGVAHGLNVDLNLHPYYPGTLRCGSLSRTSALCASNDRRSCYGDRQAGSIDGGQDVPFHRLE